MESSQWVVGCRSEKAENVRLLGRFHKGRFVLVGSRSFGYLGYNPVDIEMAVATGSAFHTGHTAGLEPAVLEALHKSA